MRSHVPSPTVQSNTVDALATGLQALISVNAPLVKILNDVRTASKSGIELKLNIF